MVYQDNSGCDTTFYKVCGEDQWFSVSLKIQKHPKSTNMDVNLSLKSTHFTVHVGILTVETAVRVDMHIQNQICTHLNKWGSLVLLCLIENQCQI